MFEENMSQPWRNWIISFAVLTAFVSINHLESVSSIKSTGLIDVKPLTVNTTPENTVSIVGDIVVLKCSENLYQPHYRIQWYEYISNSSGTLISEAEFINPDHPNAARYRIIHTTPVEFLLEISNVELNDAGMYKCFDPAVSPSPPNMYQGTAELIVLESAPVCTTSLPSHGEILEGETYTAECSVRYQGKYAPIMTWTGPPPFKLIESSNKSHVIAAIEFTGKRCKTAGEYQCLTNFYLQIPYHSNNASINTPTWEHHYTVPPFTVYWTPMDLYVQPFKFNYTVGDKLTCYSDASPAPFYQWLNMRTYETVYAQTITLNSNMRGYNQTMLCQVQNIIGNTVYSRSIAYNVVVNRY